MSVVVMIGMAVSAGRVQAQEKPNSATAESPELTAERIPIQEIEPQAKLTSTTPEAAAAALQKKRQSIVLASMLLAGVVTLALLLFLWVLWWSRRTRKILREPLPTAGRGDELWYLKAKQDVREATERLSANDPNTPPPRPES